MLTKLLAVSMIGTATLAAAAGFAPITAPTLAPSPAPARAADAFKVDTVHSAVVYRIKHLNVSYHYGRFDKIEGAFLLDKDNPGSGKIDITIPVESINSNSPDRDKHLRSPDFFSAKEFPSITFKSTGITKKGETGGVTTYEVTGDLSLRGQSKPVTVEARSLGVAPGMRGGEVSGLETTFTIKRSDFGMNYMVDKGMLGDEVTITVSLEGGR
ncbi:MAG: YceI family protein [Phycisphaerales bacterium]|nr:YceI family protein [Phycisphaerales bacterium]